jgi:acyl-CoA synthetase (AMP-forming)/AMP-acid ligase II
MAEVLIWQAEHRPDQRAFVYLERGEREAGAFTYAELDGRARVIALALIGHGLAGRPIILAYPTCLEFVAALFGCFYAGAIAIPAPIDNHIRNAARLKAVVADADAAAVLSLRSVLTQDFERTGEMAALPIQGILCIATDELARGSGTAPPMPAEPGNVALLQYTSGSTGNPRGVMLTHGNLMNNQRALSAVLASNDDDVGVNWLPLYHDMGLIGGVLHTIYFGGFTALIPPLAFVQKPIRWLQAVHRYRASISMGPGFAYSLVSQRGRTDRTEELDLSSWRVAICGGEPIRPQVLEHFAATFRPMGFDSTALMPAYGLAEATLIATAAPAGTGLIAHVPEPVAPVSSGGRHDAWQRHLACCGPAVTGQTVSIVDPKSHAPVPEGQPGEIWLQGPSVGAGYWKRPEATRATFQARLADGDDSGPWLRTGDLGFMSAAGLVVTGRAKEIIVIRGANFDPLDLEASACESDPALESGGAAAFALEHDEGELVVLVHEVKRDALRSIDVNLVRSRVIETISRCFGLRLHDLVLLRPRTLPRTTSGKIQRYVCKELYLAGQLAALEAIEHPALGRCRVREGSLT